MSKIVSIGTAVPEYQHRQDDILDFMLRVYALGDRGSRTLKFLYHQSGIATRYSVVPDYSLPAAQWQFFTASENLEPFPSIEQRMSLYRASAPALSVSAINHCISSEELKKVTHLITVSCTGLSAPGLDLELIELLGLPVTICRTSVNFMGCYAAIHALKIADAFCSRDRSANVLIVCTELCTLHFQRDTGIDSLTSSLLFGDGAAAILVSGNEDQPGLKIDSFFSNVSVKGKQQMAWEVSSTGFLMTLGSYVPSLIEENFNQLVSGGLSAAGLDKDDITHWCIHPGGKKILEAVQKSIGLEADRLTESYEVLKQFGNMSSATILFVLKNMMDQSLESGRGKVFGAAFGPGLTTETFILSA